MAQFKDVFSTTLKVLLALLIISVVLGVGFLILGGLGSIASGPSSTANSPSTSSDNIETKPDALRTTMPKSVWERGIARAVKKHCITDGMSKEEVARAWGEPTKKEDANWTWQLPPGKCLKYDGDKCTEKEERHKIIFFTAKGNVFLEGDACQTINDDFIYFEGSQLFGKNRQ